jgi:hypothetical protein
MENRCPERDLVERDRRARVIYPQLRLNGCHYGSIEDRRSPALTALCSC